MNAGKVAVNFDSFKVRPLVSNIVVSIFFILFPSLKGHGLDFRSLKLLVIICRYLLNVKAPGTGRARGGLGITQSDEELR